MIRKLAFNDDTKAAKLEQDIRTMFAVNGDSLAIGGHAIARDQNGKLYVDCFFSIPLLGP